MLAKHRKFANHFLQHLNRTKAAIAAGYAENSADVTGSRLLRNAKIKEYIAKRIEAALGADLAPLRRRIINELEAEAFGTGPQKLKALEILSKYAGVLTNIVNIGIDENTETSVLIRTIKHSDVKQD